MTKADTILKSILNESSKTVSFLNRLVPKYKDGTVANSKYVTGAFAEYDLAKGGISHHNLAPDCYQIRYQGSALDLPRPVQ